jgi:hypothetical protein
VLKVNGKNYSYLSWTDAMKIVLIAFPDMQYEVTRDPYTNLPYFEGEEIGLMCFTKVTINKITHLVANLLQSIYLFQAQTLPNFLQGNA